MKKLVSLTAVVACLALAPSAGAITFGQLDGNTHPNVGALFADYDPEVPGPDFLCSGTLISPTVFLTASHCTAFLTSVGVDPDEVFVSFSPDAANDDGSFRTGAQQLPGTYHTHPRFGPHFGDGDPHDIAVVVLDTAPRITPARLPAAGSLSSLPRGQRLTSVGYGAHEVTNSPGGHQYLYDDVRMVATGTLHAVTPAWLRVSMNRATGDGGTCYGDSGGPNFLGDSDVVAATTITGDAVCRATNVDYRLDTPSARDFLATYVPLP